MRRWVVAAILLLAGLTGESRATTVDFRALSQDILTTSYDNLFNGGPPGPYTVSPGMFDIIDVLGPVTWGGVVIAGGTSWPWFSVASRGLYLDDAGLTTGRTALISAKGFTSITLSAVGTASVSRVSFDGGVRSDENIFANTTWGQNGNYLDVPLLSINGRLFTDREIDTGAYGGVPGTIRFDTPIYSLLLAGVRAGSLNADPSLEFLQSDFETVRISIHSVTTVPLPAPLALLGAAMAALTAGAGGRRRITSGA
jgi:hypothetical protein